MGYYRDVFGMELGQAEAVPTDPYLIQRKKMETPVKRFVANPSKDKLRKFLKNDGIVLR